MATFHLKNKKLIGFSAVFFGVISLLGGLFLWVQGEGGRDWVARQIETSLRNDQQSASVREVTGNPLATFEIHGLSLSDSEGEWLRAEEISIQWKFLSLLFGSPEFTRIVSETVTLYRFPVFTDKQDDEERWTAPELVIRHIAIDFKTPLGAELSQAPFYYQIRGAGIDIGASRIRGEISLKSLAGRQDTFALFADWRRGAEAIDLRASIFAKQGGVIENILGLKGKGPIEASIEGEGKISAWQGRFSMDAGAGWHLTATLEGAGGTTLKATGEINYPQQAEEPWHTLLGTGAEFSGVLDIPDLFSPGIELKVNLPGFLANLAGQINPQDRQFLDSLQFDVRFPLIPLPSGETGSFNIASLHLTGRAGGPLKKPEFSGQYTFQGIESPWLRVGNTEGEFSLKPWRNQLAFSLAGKGQDLSINLPERTEGKSPFAEWNVRGLLDRQVEVFDFFIDEFRLADSSLSGHVQTDPDMKVQSFDIQTSLDNSFAGKILDNAALGGKTEIKAVWEKHSGALMADGRVTGLKTGNSAMDALAGNVVELHFMGRSNANGDFIITQARLEGEKMDLGVSGTLDRLKRADLTYVAGITSLEGVVSEAVGLRQGLVITGKLTGDIENPNLFAATRIESLNLWGVEFRNLETGLQLSSLFQNPVGVLEITGESPVGPLEAESRVLFRDKALSFTDLSAGLSTFEFTGGLEFRQGLVNGNLSGAFTGKEDSFAGRSFSGQGGMSLEFASLEGYQQVIFQSDLSNIRARDKSGLVSEIGTVKGQANLLLKKTGPEGSVDLEILNFFRSALALEQARIAGTLGGGAVLDLEGKGLYYEPFDFKAQGAFSEFAEGFTADFDLTADYGGRKINTPAPIKTNYSPQYFSLFAPRLALGNGNLTARLEITGESLALDASGQEIDAVLITLPWRGLVSSGTLGGALELQISPENEFLSLAISGKNLRHQGLFEVEEAPFLLDLNARAENGRLELDSALNENGRTVGTLNARLFYERNPAFAISRERPISGRLVWNGPVEPLWAFSRLFDHDLSGYLVSDVRAGGTLDNPAFSGSARLEEGEYTYLPSGLVLQNLTLTVSGAGDNLRISALDATDGSGGKVHLEGAFEISPHLAFPGKMTISAENLRFVRLDNIEARASGNLVYERGTDTASLSGGISTGVVEATISQRIPKSVVKIDVQEINRPEIPGGTITRRPSQRPPLGLSLETEIPNQFFIRGRGLESEWGGRLAISGNSNQPRINGALDLVRGYFDFAGKRFSFDSGRLVFDGRPEIDPEISLVSRTRTSTVDAEIRITGRLSSPLVTMSSVPVLPEDEILSHLLFGTSVGDLSPLQLAELGSALASLSGGGEGLNVLASARKGLGLDILSLSSDPDLEQGTLITGGKYLTRDVYLEIETATATGETITRLLYDITKRFRAESEVSQNRGSSLKIKWFWDY